MEVTTEWIAAKYGEFNEKYFGGRLPKRMKFKVSKSKSYWGQACYSFRRSTRRMYGMSIIISNYYDSPEYVKEQTLLHEMIHILDYTTRLDHYYDKNGRRTKGYSAHGPWFKAECRRIEAMSEYKLETHATDEEYEVSRLSDDITKKAEAKAKAGYYIAFLYYPDKDYYFTLKVGNKQIEDAKRWLTEGRWQELYGDMMVYRCYSEKYASMRCSLKSSHGNISKEAMMELIAAHGMAYAMTVRNGGTIDYKE